MQIPHVTEPFLEGPVLFFFGEVDLDQWSGTSMVYQTVPLSFCALANLIRYLGYLIINISLPGIQKKNLNANTYNSMSSINSLDLSIQLEENHQKTKEQELEEFVELTKKIAESDRNNDLLREIKKNKNNEVTKMRMAHREAVDSNDSLQQELDKLGESGKEMRSVCKAKSDYYEQLTKKYEELALKEKQMQEKNTTLSKDNDRLQKTIISLQNEYDELTKKNKEKSVYLQKLKKKKDIQDELILESQNKIQELEDKCENTKNRAVQLEQALCTQNTINEGFQKAVAEKEKALEGMRREREENHKRQEENKRTTNKLVAKIKTMEEEIARKEQQISRLTKVHLKLETEVDSIEQSQKMYEQLLVKRREIIQQLRRDSTKLKKGSDSLAQAKSI